MLYKIFPILFLFVSLSGYATHLRSGEISYKAVPGQPNTFDITVTIYTNSSVGILADLNTISLSFGDGTSAGIERGNGPGGINSMNQFCRNLGEIVSPGIRKNIFTITHKYSENKKYILSTAPNARNTGIVNIDNSGTYGMYIEAMLTSGIPNMNSPELTFPPIDDGCLNFLYKINPGAVDHDGDELFYSLVSCKTTDGVVIPSYKFPNEIDPATNFNIDARTGVITWDKPTISGEYNIAFVIMKMRNHEVIGYVIRDMQVTIAPCQNNPPRIEPIPDICVTAGNTLTYKITSHDPDNDSLVFETTGSPYQLSQNPATYTPDVVPKGSTSGTFTWNTIPAHFTKNPYQVYYRVIDLHAGAPSLTDVVSNFITVVVPPVKNVFATVYQHGNNVKWDQPVNSLATGYNVYRKQGISIYPFDSCTRGVPIKSGFSLIGTVDSQNTLSLTDTDNGKGLVSGFKYCYMVTATFKDGLESSPSLPYCSTLMLPIIRMIQDTLTLCEGKTVILDSTIINFENIDQSATFKWTSSPSVQINDLSNPHTSVKLTMPGNYALHITATSGVYTDTATIYFQVNPIPKPSIKIVDLTGMPDTVMFYNKSQYEVKADWLFPDGTRSTSLDSVLYIFQKNGDYRVYLKVYNSLGCPDTTSVLYRVRMKGLAMPNAFEPDNPNVDLKTFKPKALGLKLFFMGVWDLWGNLLWSTDKVDQYQEPLEGWNGNDSKGRKMPSQNYIWRMNATFIDGTVWKGVKDHFGHYHKEGTLTLLR